MQDLLKCNYCQLSFVDVVKIVPDCGALICGTCHDDLNISSSNRTFECQSCGKQHTMHQEGLADVKPIMQMLKLKPESPVAASDQSNEFKSMVEEVRERIARLESFDSQEEINTYCDQLKLQVTEALESSIKQANKLHGDMLKQIDQYRDKLLQEQVSAVKEPHVKQELVDLSKQLDELSLRGGEPVQCQYDIQAANNRVKEIAEKLKFVKNKLMAEAIDSQFLRFRSDQDPDRIANQFGRLVLENTANGNSVKGILDFVILHLK